ncbi:hypothetical protein E2562_028398 [Oryza meyeriana var. granulata]|uniref:Uncharacterized protein n=1 Tax=Oryza meyeriana var. granulata TaxID=110450 RepID=A0A6G1E3X3_9ORYZ|nr:hypothetical protein E2562_028398 [Oryza meyeriana var. granulata]
MGYRTTKLDDSQARRRKDVLVAEFVLGWNSGRSFVGRSSRQLSLCNRASADLEAAAFPL